MPNIKFATNEEVINNDLKPAEEKQIKIVTQVDKVEFISLQTLRDELKGLQSQKESIETAIQALKDKIDMLKSTLNIKDRK